MPTNYNRLAVSSEYSPCAIALGGSSFFKKVKEGSLLTSASLFWNIFLIADTTDREPVVIVEVVPGHTCVAVVQVPIPRAAVVVLRRRPEEGVGAQIVERRDAEGARRHGGKTAGVVLRTAVVARDTGIGAVTPVTPRGELACVGTTRARGS